MQRTAHGPSSLTKPSKRKFLLDSSSELSEIPRTEARKRFKGSVQKLTLTGEQLTRPALGMTVAERAVDDLFVQQRRDNLRRDLFAADDSDDGGIAG